MRSPGIPLLMYVYLPPPPHPRKQHSSKVSGNLIPSYCVPHVSSQRTCDFQDLKIPRGPKNHQNLKILVSIFSQFWWRVPLIKNTRGTLSCTDDHNKGFSWWSNFWGGVNQHFSLPLFWHWRSTARGLSCICILKTNNCTMSWSCSKMTLTVFWIPQCSLLSNSKWLRILLCVLLSQNERCHCTIG